MVIETVDGQNIMFGNPNNSNVQSQPYILIVGRDMVSKLREEAKSNGISKDLIESITSDSDNNYQAGSNGKIELNPSDNNGKCLYLIKYWKEKGEVFWNKSTKHCPIVENKKLGMMAGESIQETKITRYPVVFDNWFKVKNCFHGLPVMAGCVDNQIVINQLLALVAYWMRFNAFGKVIYDSSRITAYTNKIGTAIPANGEVSNIVHQLRAGDFNGGVLTVIDMFIKYTKEVIGSSDALMGLTKPENTSAIIAVSKQSSIPLQNIQDHLYSLIDDLTLIEGEFILKKYNQRKISYKENGKKMVTTINTEKFRNLLLRAKTDVGPSNFWSEITSLQTLDNLLLNGHITILQYLERLPEGYLPNKQGLINEIRQEMEQIQLKQQEYEQMAKFVDSLPPEQQTQLEQLMKTNPQQYEEVVRQLMGSVQGISQGVENVQPIE
jgi:hypothetical protein